ncbi:MAG TPA: TetR/AcrR family transcriptional regulator [Steroidobacter sp.]|uniref:TetR/AcrR family transcriptional regulator n=1 Tax=Steroidobacter sp. TaxID=1978227 RepID=UPI002EDB9537
MRSRSTNTSTRRSATASTDVSITQRGEQQRDELIEAAIELFAANGYAGTSIRDIAKLTGRSVSNVYHYFADKEALWLAILEYSVQGMPARLRSALEGEGDGLARFRRLVRVHLEESVRHRREAKIFFIDEERLSPAGKRINRQIQKEILDIYLTQLAQLKSAGLIATRNLRVLAFNVLGVINWHLRWQDRIAGVSIEETHEEIVEFILHGMRGPHAAEADGA